MSESNKSDLLGSGDLLRRFPATTDSKDGGGVVGIGEVGRSGTSGSGGSIVIAGGVLASMSVSLSANVARSDTRSGTSASESTS